MDGLAVLAEHKLWLLLSGGLLFPVALKLTEYYLSRRANREPPTTQLFESYRQELTRLTSEITRLQQMVLQRDQEYDVLWRKQQTLRKELEDALIKIADLERNHG